MKIVAEYSIKISSQILNQIAQKIDNNLEASIKRYVVHKL